MTDLPLSKALGIINGSDLRPVDKLTWWAIHELCVGNGTCKASTFCIGKKIGDTVREKQILGSIKRLEGAGFLKVVRIRGCANGYQPCVPAKDSQKGQHLKDVLKAQSLKGGGFEQSFSPTTVKKDSAFWQSESLREEQEQEKNSTPPISPPQGGTPRRPKSFKPKAEPPRDTAVIQAALDKIDLGVFRQKYGPQGVVVELVFERFIESCLGNDPKLPGINPRDYVNFASGFHTWCQLDAKRTRQRDGPGCRGRPPVEDEDWKYKKV